MFLLFVCVGGETLFRFGGWMREEKSIFDRIDRIFWKTVYLDLVDLRIDRNNILILGIFGFWDFWTFGFWDF